MHLLLVDDEFFVRERIVKQIDWKALGIDEIQTAENGLMALEIIRNFKPDILLTDVRMPQMDGIKLAEEISCLYADCKIIFISGYSDVPYLRSAIRLHVVNYVEKPIDMAELSKSIQNAVEEINSNRLAQCGRIHIQQKNEMEQRKAIAKGLTQEESAGASAELIKQTIDMSTFAYYTTAITQIIGFGEQTHITEEEVQEYLSQSFTDPEVQCIGFLKQDRIVMQLLCQSPESRRKERIKPYFSKLISLLSQNGLTGFSVVGRFVKDPKELRASYQTALQSLPRCYFKEPGYLHLYREEQNNAFDLDSISISEYSHALKKENDKSITFLINNLTAQLKTHDGTSPFQVVRFFYSILVLMYRAAQKENVMLSARFTDEYQMLDYINQLHFLDELHEFTMQTIQQYYAKVNNSLTENTVVNHILIYLEQNYPNPDLSVTMISEHLQLSSTYVCHLFKNTLGVTLGAYLTQLRIDKALELMESRNYKVKDIAQKVGYRNGNYFSYKFKKRMGYSPSGEKD
ncbi:MAG: response regulator [Eubacteriales bacterium]|nr:response regulator [Eubacteriales bacterium]